MAWVLIILSLLYLLAMFFLARGVERQRIFKGKRSDATFYVLSLAAYCTAWTFYGSIGRASETGIDFLAIYFGPTLALPFFFVIGRKVIRITRLQHITSMADFFASRYGKSQQIGRWVTLICVLAIVPYIALQIQAVSNSFEMAQGEGHNQAAGWLPTLIFTLVVGGFTLLYGTKYIGSGERRRGMVSVIAVESAIKLLAFLLAGGWIIWVLNNGFHSSFQSLKPEVLADLTTLSAPVERMDFLLLTLISGLAFFLLPRQFQLGIIENTNEDHLKHALWGFPLYLLLINLLVLPLAFLGMTQLGGDYGSDFYFLGLAPSGWLRAVIYLGGFSAATSMMIVSSISLSNMISAYWIIPRFLDRIDEVRWSVVNIRRISVGIVFLLGFIFYSILGDRNTLVSIGIISFVGVAQLAPSFFGGILWKQATGKGALSGMIIGLFIWFFGLVIPSTGGLGMALEFIPLIPGFSTTSSIIFLSLLLNGLVFTGVSLFTHQPLLEQNQAELFVRVDRYLQEYSGSSTWEGSVAFGDIRSLLIRFLGDERTEAVLDRYARINDLSWDALPHVDARVINYAERLLTDAIGSASARAMIETVVRGKEIGLKEMMNIVNESRQTIRLNKELRQQSEQLERASSKLREVNEKLMRFSQLKDEFLYTVTHELRTPLTSIRAQAEILQMEPDMSTADQQMFINNIVEDCDRLTRLITNVLDLEKYESGSQHLQLDKQRLEPVIRESIRSVKPIAEAKGTVVDVQISTQLPKIWFDRDRILQVLINLLSNAIKFTPEVNGKVTINAFATDSYVHVNLLDNGPGITKEEIELIFDKFYQANNQTRVKPTGTGLGLAICKNIIQMHGGWIQAENLEEGGSRFTFTIPLNITPESP